MCPYFFDKTDTKEERGKGGERMARPRKQTYTLEMYLKKINEGDIDNNADVQRRMVWSREQMNELIVTVLTDEYIPPIILGEESSSQLHIADGGCRSAALNGFWNGTHKITGALENSLIPYKKKVKKKDGGIDWVDAVCDIRNKTFDKLPDELKKKFNEYQIETVIHENCDSHKISRYIKRYNNHTSMNADQKAFTYIDKFAGNIRKLLDSRFFLDYSVYTEKDKVKGSVERVVVETMMCMNHLDSWKKQPKAACRYLNENAAKEEFDQFAAYLQRLEAIITDDIKGIFNKKDSFLFLTLFDRFTKLRVEDRHFAEFLRAFQGELRFSRKNKKGLLFDEIDRELSTKDRQVIVDKLDMLEELLLEFLHTDAAEASDGSIESFVAEMVDLSVEEVREDMELYTESLHTLLEETVKIDSPLRSGENRPSLLAMMAYSYKADKDMDHWMAEYARQHHTYCPDQKKNFLSMQKEFERYCRKKVWETVGSSKSFPSGG